MSYSFDDNVISDLHKDARGFRPSVDFMRMWNEQTDDQKQIIWDALIFELNEEIDAEKERDALAIAAFEANIKQIMEAGRVSRKTAIQWFVRSLDIPEEYLDDTGYICHEARVPYSCEQEFIDAGFGWNRAA